MNVLFYTPVNFRCRDIESLAKEYSKGGHHVFLLSQCVEGPMHHSFRVLGMDARSGHVDSRVAAFQMIKYCWYLIRFCRENKIHILFSHLEPTNFISVLIQYFIKSKVIIYRHHINEARLYKFDRSLTYRLTYRLARTIICVSRQAKDFMIKEEKISNEKIFHINLGYDFSLYALPESSEVKRIKNENNAELLLVSVGRLTKYKRPDISIELVRKANLSGIDTSILFLGAGEEEQAIRQKANEYGILDKVIFVGYSQQTLNYLAAADLLIHPSILESSCVVIKEAALVELPVMICSGVGDFDDYMIDEVNGIVLDKDKFVDDGLVHLDRLKIA